MAENQIIKEDISKEIKSENKAGEFDIREEMKGKDINVSIKKKVGNPNWQKGVSANPKGRPKNIRFSLRDDLVKSLKKIKRNNPDKYWQIINSYWEDAKLRQFLLEIVDGKARQSAEMVGTMENPVRIVEVKPTEENETNETKRLNKSI